MCEPIFQEYFNHQAWVNNAGGPSSRVMEQPVRAFFMRKVPVTDTYRRCSLIIPSNEKDIEGWLVSLANKNGWSDLREAVQNLDMPTSKMLLSPMEKKLCSFPMEDRAILKTALILARCNDHYYIPDSPLILTCNRLNRSVLLTKINLKQFYGMD